MTNTETLLLISGLGNVAFFLLLWLQSQKTKEYIRMFHRTHEEYMELLSKVQEMMNK